VILRLCPKISASILSKKNYFFKLSNNRLSSSRG
jgi:hypothetical protein